MERLEALRHNSEEKMARLRTDLRGMGSALVAFSGGVDSTFLLAVAKEVLGDRVVAITAFSPTMPEQERLEASRLVARMAVRHVEVASREGDDPRFAKNPIDRCYYCKSELFRLCQEVARREGLAAVLDGSNVDDRRDHRPGNRAAVENAVRSPLAEAGFTKDEIRAWSEALKLPTWDKPQMACLASRIPYGTAITPDRLAQIDHAETRLRSFGLRSFRVRYHGELARIEVAEEELELALARRAEIVPAVKESGFRLVVLDLEPYRSGRLNELAGVTLPVVG